MTVVGGITVGLSSGSACFLGHCPFGLGDGVGDGDGKGNGQGNAITVKPLGSVASVGMLFAYS